jgi:hypothetical protein
VSRLPPGGNEEIERFVPRSVFERYNIVSDGNLRGAQPSSRGSPGQKGTVSGVEYHEHRATGWAEVECAMRTIAIFSVCLLLSPVTFATTCIRPEPAALFAKADFIFEAIVETRQKEQGGVPAGVCWTEGDRCGPKVATLRVGRVWKGELGEHVTIRSIDGCYCLGTYLFVGDRYVVFATRAPGDTYDMDDMGGCATELMANAEKRGFIETLNALAAR